MCVLSTAQITMGTETERRRNRGAAESTQRHAGLPVPRAGTCLASLLGKRQTEGREIVFKVLTLGRGLFYH